MLRGILLSVVYAEYCNLAHYSECHFAEYDLNWVSQSSQLRWVSFMLSFPIKLILLSVIHAEYHNKANYAESHSCWV